MNSEVRRILVVEDERAIAEAVAARLRAEGFAVEVAGDGPTGVAAAQRIRPDLVVLDIMLPGFDGLEVCRRIQAERPVPVIMLTARDEETDLLVGLAVGADDYLTKPFSVRELAARVHALLRRMEKALVVNRAEPAPPITIGNLEINPAERRVRSTAGVRWQPRAGAVGKRPNRRALPAGWAVCCCDGGKRPRRQIGRRVWDVCVPGSSKRPRGAEKASRWDVC